MLSSIFKDKTFEISRSSATIRDGTLSYYFNHNEGSLSPSDAPTPQNPIKTKPSNMTPCPNYTNRSAGNDHPQRGSSSANGQWRPLLDAQESGAPLSWLSTLFSRRKKQQQQQARSGHACHDESKYEPFSPATTDWEPPRASSWEQLSSWEKPSSSLWNQFSTEPHRASDTDIQQLRPAITVRVAPALIDASMQKQGSSRKGKLQWVKSLIAIDWAIKLRRRIRKKRVAEQGRGEGEEDDRESTMSATPSTARGNEFLQNGIQNDQNTGGQERVLHSQGELGATWSSHYSPLLHGGYASKSRRSYHRRGDNGLLRFYLTPTRGFKIGSKRPRNHHPLIPEI